MTMMMEASDSARNVLAPYYNLFCFVLFCFCFPNAKRPPLPSPSLTLRIIPHD